MSDVMSPISFSKLLDEVFEEFKRSQIIFEIPKTKFYHPNSNRHFELFSEAIDTPLGPAAGPHTQLAQNIIASYLSGGRFFELKTVQILDALEFPKPCICAEDEGYNTEWSTELSIEDALNEYVKAWFILHLLQKELFNLDDRSFQFNMSVGYDLKGIQSSKVDHFIESLKDASNLEFFKQCKDILFKRAEKFQKVNKEYIDGVSSNICNSITLSTMHGCPPAEIEAICKYLLREKKLHTYVKMNPTLHGYSYVRETFDRMGYSDIKLKEESFTHDLQYADGIEMLKRLKAFSREHQREFGIKLSNTLPVKISHGELPGEEMYMSGRALYPLTINLAYKLAAEFDGDLRVSYSGGADFFNINRIFSTGIGPITVATTLLKPGGYLRLKQMAELLEPQLENKEFNMIDLDGLKALAESAFDDANHLKRKRPIVSRKIPKKLPLMDCFVAPCTVGCPINQDIPEYIRLVGEGRYEEAFQVIVAKNPLPFITGTICNHSCMLKCTRLDYDESVLIRDMKLVVAQKGYEEYLKQAVKTDFSELELLDRLRDKAKVAIIGAGPSGLAAGYFLAKAGLNVTIMDKRERAGGTVEYVIPEFRLAREQIQKDIHFIQRVGVNFEFGINPNISVSELKAKGYSYIFLAIGAGRSTPLELKGDTQNVMSAIPFLEKFNESKEQLNLGKNVAVIGGGNTAMDAARAALRVAGVEKVYILYRRTKDELPADREELELALTEGVQFMELIVPLALGNGVLKCQRMELGELDSSGRKNSRPKEGEFEEIFVDVVLSAIGEQVDYELLRKNRIQVNEKGVISIHSDTLETNIENVFIGGDALFGPSTVVLGIAHGTKVAGAIAAKEHLSWEENWFQTYLNGLI
jgi:putative selenate reductase